MKNRKRKGILSLPLIIIISIFVLKFWAQEECTEYVITAGEDFDTVGYKDVERCSIANWPSGPIHLNYLGGNFEITEPTGMGAKIYVCAAGDFDGDGKPDLIGLDITDEEDNKLLLIRNYYEDLDGDEIDDDGTIFQVDHSETYDWGFEVGPAAITVADFNDDGLFDFFFYSAQEDVFEYDESFMAAIYINQGTEADPDFRRYTQSPNLNFTSEFINKGIYCVWAGDHARAVDLDEDGDQDILVISEDKIFLMRNPGPLDFDLDHWEVAELNYDERTGFDPPAPGGYEYRGGSAVHAGDFDNDGDLDIIGGTVNRIDHLVYYVNDGNGYFTRENIPIPEPNCMGTVALFVEDFNTDGRLDIFGANDRWNAGNEARMWLMRNKLVEAGELEFSFECQINCDPILPEPHDVDLGASCDYDGDGDLDIIVADGNHSGDYYLIRNDLAPVYTTYGEAWSTNLAPGLDPNSHAVTKVRLTNIEQRVQGDAGGLKVDYYVSNNGIDWEFYVGYEDGDIRNYAGGSAPPVHSFTHFGSQLKWKAILIAEEDQMDEYTGASYETPEIDNLEFEYTYVEQREYSRTSVATTVHHEGEQRRKLIIGGSFIFPGWRGYLRAYDVSEMALEGTSTSILRTVTRPNLASPGEREIIPEGVSIFWDAGEILASRAASVRVIYTANRVDSVLTRLDFTIANVAALGSILQDFNNDNEGLINFVRGEGRSWKLGDINHSNPVVVGAPEGVPGLMGDGYEVFQETWKDRRKVLCAGANDGILHCFDILTGEELWGFIPYNLLPKLREMWPVDQITGERYSIRHPYVDGSPVVEDVYIDANGDASKEWITILVCGQGRGRGSIMGGGTTGNFYFALDITNPENPQPLWEFTHNKMGETWSVPVIGKVKKGGIDTWVAFMGSGYDNVEGPGGQGYVFYAVDLETGESFWEFEANDVNTNPTLGWNIKSAFPGSPSSVDTGSDGYVDRVYIGDLDGRMWKVDVSDDFIDEDSWSSESIYEDSNNYPILTKPALWLNPVAAEPVPHLYFGTGGDDNASPDSAYSFVALVDGAIPEVEWYLGDQETLALPAEKDMGDLDVGEKVWADPKVADYIVYFSTLKGSIESVNPCENIAGEGKLYARYVQAVAGGTLGGTALRTESGPSESLALAIKTRAAVTLGERGRTESASRKREVYIQEYDSTLQRLEQGVVAMLQVRSFREIFRIIR